MCHIGVVRRFFNLISRYYIIGITSLSILGGVVVFGFSIYMNKHYRDYDDSIRDIAVWAPLSFAIGLVVTGILGLLGVCWFNQDNTCFSQSILSLYLIATFALWMAVLIAAIFLLVYIMSINNIAVTNSYLLKGVDSKVNTWQMLVFNKCCYEHSPSWGDFEVLPCEIEEGLENPEGEPHLGCANQIGGGEPCACVTDAGLYDRLESSFTLDACTALSEVMFAANKPFIGDPNTTSGCGDGNPKSMQQDMATYTFGVLFPVAFAIFGVAALMLTGGCASCCMLSFQYVYIYEKQF